MISLHTPGQSTLKEPALVIQRPPLPPWKATQPKLRSLRSMMWLSLILVCLGTVWFAYQCFLVPQPKSFTPDWHGAQWVRAVGSATQVAYFRSGIDLVALPQDTFITVAASQRFHLYVNGALIGSNIKDFGSLSQAYMFDIASTIVPGANVIAIRVDNLDNQPPSLILSLGLVFGNSITYSGTGPEWRAASQPGLVYAYRSLTSTGWTASAFDANAWPPAQIITQPPVSPGLLVNPQIYEHPMSTNWMSAGNGHDAYFVHRSAFPSDITGAWLRLVAAGDVHIFINSNLVIAGNYQPRIRLNLIKYFASQSSSDRYQGDLSLNVYDISPYLHAGVNTIAIHWVSAGINGNLHGLANVNDALSLDILVATPQGSNIELSPDGSWHTAHQPVPDWTVASSASLAWPSPTIISRPGFVHAVYLSDKNAAYSSQFIPLQLTLQIVLWSVGAILAFWLLISVLYKCAFGSSLHSALEHMSKGYLPALACEGLLIGLSFEPLLHQPFPYASNWGILLIVLVVVGFGLLWLNAYMIRKRRAGRHTLAELPFVNISPRTGIPGRGVFAGRFEKLKACLRAHWAIIPLVLIGTLLIFYNLGYEPYWQDELTSYYVARSIMTHGLPLLPSGFFYPKGELYSYMLALSMTIFGNQGGAPRLISATEYIISIPLLYMVGCHFFNQRIAWLATAMLTLSPFVLVWGRQVRMYEQAQVLILLTLFLFYKAIHEPRRVRLLYVASGCLLLAYLSHEESFITFPAFVICILVASKQKKRFLPAVFYQKHWWFALGLIGSVIGAQLAIVHFTHPPVLGTDASQRPPIQLTTDNIPYYFYFLFNPSGNNSGITGTLITGNNTLILLNSVLATIGCMWGIRSKDMRIKYCALFFLCSFATLLFGFTMQADRYFYPLFTLYYLLGAYALVRMLSAVCAFVSSGTTGMGKKTPAAGFDDKRGASFFAPARLLAACIVAPICLCILIMPMIPLSSYNLFVSRVAGLTYFRHYVDYEGAGQYVESHWQRGDIVISIIPDQIVSYYAGQSDYFFSIDHTLFLFERNGHIVDTYTGNVALLDQRDFQDVLDSHSRIWILSANDYYQSAVFHRFAFPPDFHIVYEGDESIVYLRGN